MLPFGLEMCRERALSEQTLRNVFVLVRGSSAPRFLALRLLGHAAEEGAADGEEPLSSKVTGELQGQSQLGQESGKAADRTASGPPPGTRTAGQGCLLVSAARWPSGNQTRGHSGGARRERWAQEEGETLVSHRVTCGTGKRNTEPAPRDPESARSTRGGGKRHAMPISGAECAGMSRSDSHRGGRCPGRFRGRIHQKPHLGVVQPEPPAHRSGRPPLLAPSFSEGFATHPRRERAEAPTGALYAHPGACLSLASRSPSGWSPFLRQTCPEHSCAPPNGLRAHLKNKKKSVLGGALRPRHRPDETHLIVCLPPPRVAAAWLR